jgi:hypothetical protein
MPMRIQVAADIAHLDREDLKRWMRLGMVKVVMAGNQRTIPHTELPLLKLLPPLLEAGFTDRRAFDIATAMLTHPPAKHGHTFRLTDTIRIHIAHN